MQTYLFPLFLIFSVKQYVNVTIAAIISHISVVFLKWYYDLPIAWQIFFNMAFSNVLQ